MKNALDSRNINQTASKIWLNPTFINSYIFSSMRKTLATQKTIFPNRVIHALTISLCSNATLHSQVSCLLRHLSALWTLGNSKAPELIKNKKSQIGAQICKEKLNINEKRHKKTLRPTFHLFLFSPQRPNHLSYTFSSRFLSPCSILGVANIYVVEV